MTWIETIIALREKHLPTSQQQVELALRVQVADMLNAVKAGNTAVIDPEPMRMAMRKVAMPTFADGFDEAAAFYGGDVKAGFLTGEEELLRYLQSFGMAKVKVINETTRRMLLTALIEGLDEGLDAFTIAERLYARWLVDAPTDGPISMARTENIARTEIGAALNAGSLAGAREVGMTHKTWSSVRDFRTRRPEQRGYDHYSNWDPETGTGAHGQIRMLDEPFIISGEQLMFPGDSSLGAGAANVAQCFPAGTEIVGDDIHAAFKSWYDGELVSIETASGNKLTGTPNHPVLTDRGWVGMGLLNEGDRVFVSGGRWRCPWKEFDVQNVPTSIEKVFDALSVVGMPVRVAGVAVDFYGDRPTGDVDVVFARSALRGDIESGLCEGGGELGLELSDVVGRELLGDGSSFAHGIPMLSGQSLDGGTGGTGKGHSFGGGGLRHPEIHSITSAPSLDLGVIKNTSNYPPRHPVPSGDGLLGHSSDVFRDDGQFVDLPPSVDVPSRALDAAPLDDAINSRYGHPIEFPDVLNSLSDKVSLDDVVVVGRVPFSGHVYTVSTGSGLYAAEGIVVRNCRCAQTYSFKRR